MRKELLYIKAILSHIQFYVYKQLFDLPIYNLDHQNYEGIKFSKIEESRRKKYIYTYLTSPETQDLHNFDIITSVFKGL